MIELGTAIGVKIRAERATERMLDLATQAVNGAAKNALSYGQIGGHRVIRRYWFGSVQGSERDLAATQALLRRMGYEAVLFIKRKGRDEKGVDLAVAREMLMHGFSKNYDTACLVAGDEDYLGLVHDVKRLGPIVMGAFFDSSALSPRLRLAFDDFTALETPKLAPDLLSLLMAEA